ncbi:MAG: hypothetical protein U0894_11350 [Pirellulales bacterium]
MNSILANQVKSAEGALEEQSEEMGSRANDGWRERWSAEQYCPSGFASR